MTRTAAIVFAKEPRPGRAKTRLAAGVGAERACALAEAFLLDTLGQVRAAGLELWVAFDPAEARGWFLERAPDARLVPQADGDLGARMAAAVQAALDDGAERVLCLGMDTPHASPDALTRAAHALANSDLVIGPSEDGGYWLLGQRAVHPEVFEDMPWSASHLLEETLRRTRELIVTRAEATFDVDEPGDLERLRALLGEDPRRAPLSAAKLLD